MSFTERFAGQEDAPFCFSLENPDLKVNAKIINLSTSTFFYRNECVIFVVGV